MGVNYAHKWGENILGRARSASKALNERELPYLIYSIEARMAGELEGIISERQRRAGGQGTGSRETLWVMPKNFEFMLSWINVEGFTGQNGHIRTAFLKDHPDVCREIIEDQGQKPMIGV